LEAVREEGRAASRAVKITRSRPLRPTPGVSPIGAASSRRSFLSVRTASSWGGLERMSPEQVNSQWQCVKAFVVG
jgi:hypothetical protein